MKRALCFAVASICVIGLIQAQAAEDFFHAIRAGDLETLRHLCANPVNVRDRLDTTPLHYAALYGNTESVRILLEHGADPNARNKSNATPLIYAAYSFEKTRLLVEKGADVNAKSAGEMTPLLVAVSTHGNTATVKYLIDKGADVKAVGPLGSDVLQTAALKGDTEMIRLLLKKGADARQKDMGGFSALMNAFTDTDQERVRLLLDAGADVNAANTFSGAVKNGPIALVHMTPIFLAATDAPTPTIKVLLSAGARPDEADTRKLTPLMSAILTDDPKLATIHELIGAGADVNAKDHNGESVLDWALKYKNPDVVTMLKAAGAKSAMPFTAPKPPADFVAGTTKDAVGRSSALLVKSGETFFPEGGGCVGCHHQPLMGRAFAALRAANQAPDDRLRRIFSNGMVANRPFMLSNYPQLVSRGGDFDENLAESEAMIALGEPANSTTDAILHYLAARQQPSGSWAMLGNKRPPLEGSTISRTAMAVRALKTFGWPARREEFEARIARARVWLLSANPVTRYEEADRIKGLKAAGVPDRDLEKSVAALIAEQRPDGGWSQTAYLESDAYATGVVLASLYQNGFLKPSDPAYTRGVAYLLKTQFPDGSWYVRSRSPKLQPYFQSAFPFDHDQWISTSATAVAVMALAPAVH
ncbi:MAG TPA: ankyrin repeat domain-containing protein [Bryobacteraceae bacterium]|nr:ankyrin repeat domain-containing protein [Bryobacteraceae bacterium]